MYKTATLSNGIRIVSQKIDSFRSVSVGIWVRAGSATEANAENGISHFIEHMLFKGTATRSAQQIAADIDRIGGQINAFTGKEYTCFYVKSIDERIDEATDVLCDMFANSVFDEKELAREKGVVLEEISMAYDTPDDLVHDRLSDVFFGAKSTLSKTILGPAENIRGFGRRDIISYMDRLYVPANTVVSVVGNFDEAALVPMLEKKLSGIGRVAPVIELSAGERREQGRRFDFTQKDIEQVHVCLGLPAVPMNDERKYALSVVNNAFGGAMSSRLFQSIREEKGLAYSVYSYCSMYCGEGMFTLYAGASPANAPEVVSLMLAELRKLKSCGLTADEFEKSREQLRGSFILGLESTSSRMTALGKGILMDDPELTEEAVLEKLDAVTNDELSEAIDLICDETQLCAAFVGKNDEKALTVALEA